MKSLYLLRHGKSSWSEPGLSDQQRPLNHRGLRDVPAMGVRFRDRGESLDHILASPALRARQTAELFAENCDFATQAIAVDADLYFLGSGSIEDAIARQDDRVQSLLLVFHNPDITAFVNSIDYAFRLDNMPTSGLVKLNCDIARWRDWDRANVTFDYYDYPKNDTGAVLRAE